MSLHNYWKETRYFSWSSITDWREFTVIIDEQVENYSSSFENMDEVWKRGGVVGNGEKGSLFFWRLQEKNALEIVSLSTLYLGKLQGVRLVFPSQVLCCIPAFLVIYKSSDREVEMFIYTAQTSGIVCRLCLTWRSGIFYEPHCLDKCYLSRGISVKQLSAIAVNVCLAVVANWPTIFRIVFSDSSHSFQLLEIPETRESITKMGLLGRVFGKKHFSGDYETEHIVCSKTDKQGQFLLVVDSSGLFSLIDCNLLSCVAQTKYQKLAKNEYCEIFPCERDHFVVVLFVDDALSPSLHLLDLFVQRDPSNANESVFYRLVVQTRLRYNRPIHIQFGCYMEREETLVIEDEEGRIFTMYLSAHNLPFHASDPLCGVFDYYSEWNEYGGLGWALDNVYEKAPIQMLFAPCRFSDDILAKVLKQPNYASRLSLYSYARSQSLSTDDYKRLILSATRLSWETESSLLSISGDESFCIFFVIRQGYVSILRPMESFEAISLEEDVENVSELLDKNSLNGISSLPEILRHSTCFNHFSNSLLQNSLPVLFLQWVTSLKAWKQRQHYRQQDILEEDFLLYYANFPSEHSISSSLLDEFVCLWLKKPHHSLFDYPLSLWIKDNFTFWDSEVDCYVLFSYLCKFFTPTLNVIVFLYDRNEWKILLDICEVLKDRYPIACYGVGCWTHLKMQHVDLAESFLTRLLEVLDKQESFTETQLVKLVTGIEKEPLSFWLREAFFKFLDRLGHTNRAIDMGKAMIPIAPDDSSVASIRTFIFNGYMKNRDWKNALELLLSTIHVGSFICWMDDFYLLVHSLAEHRQLGLLDTFQLPLTLYYRIGEILYLRLQGQQLTCQSSLDVFVEHLVDTYRWYFVMKEFYLASRIAFEGYCKLLETFDSIAGLAWLRTCNRLIGLVCISLSMISNHEDRYLLLNGPVWEVFCKHSGFHDWLSSLKESEIGSNMKVELELLQFLSVVRGAQQWLLEHVPIQERNGGPLLKLVDISSVQWLLTRLVYHKEWSLSFQIAYRGSYLLRSDQLFVFWFRLVGSYLMGHDSLEDSLWGQLLHFLSKAESLYVKFCPGTFSYGEFGIVLLQGILSNAPTNWCIPRWLLEFSGWGKYSGFHGHSNSFTSNKKGNMSRLMQLLIKHGRQKEAIEFMCVSLEKSEWNEILITWNFIDALLFLTKDDDTVDKDIIKSQKRLRNLALTCLRK